MQFWKRSAPAVTLGACLMAVAAAPAIAASSATKAAPEKLATHIDNDQRRLARWFPGPMFGHSGYAIYCRYYRCRIPPPPSAIPDAYRYYRDAPWGVPRWRDW